ncbi:MAG TPA: PAS domain S-box protein, partial [Candidatus Nitrosotalea sp.]|nr:PAS domain S-box protein [Candidatus Nitrosotalea sp.]
IELEEKVAESARLNEVILKLQQESTVQKQQHDQALAEQKQNLEAAVAERIHLTESLRESRKAQEMLQQRHHEELEKIAKAHEDAIAEKELDFEKHQQDSDARVKELNATLEEVRERLKKEAAARLQSEQEALNTREELAARLKQHTGELLGLNENLKVEIAERKRVDEELLQARSEFNQRAKDHTAELIKAGEDLRAMVAERTRVEELLARTREESESKLNERGRELAEARRQLEVESAARLNLEQLHQKANEVSEKQSKELAGKLDRVEGTLKQRESELAQLNEQLNCERAARTSADEAVRKTQADLEAAKKLDRRELVYACLGRTLGECSTPAEAARVVASASHDLFGWDACTVDLYSMDDNRVHPVLNIDTVNGRHADVPASYLDPSPTPVMQRVIKEGPQLVLRKGTTGSHTDDVLFGDRARLSASLMCVPIKAGGKVTGFFSIQSYAPDAYDSADLAGLEALADHYAGALERVRAEEMQRRSEDRFRLVARATTDIVWDWNLPMNQIWRNDVFQTVFGYRPEEIEMGIESWESRLHPDDRERVMSSLRKSLEHEDQFWSAEYRFRRADGSYAHVNDRGYVIRDKNGKAIRMVGAMLDISHHKQVEEAMIEGQARKGAILESALDAIVTVDHEGRIFEWNPAAERMFAYRRAEVLGNQLSEMIIPSALRETYEREMGQHLAVGGGTVIGKRVELTAMRADGSEFPVELAISRIPTEGPPIFTGFIRDIAERKRAEMEIQKLAAFPRRNPNPVFEFAVDGSLTYFNDAAQEMALSLGKDHPLAILPDRATEVVKDCLAKGQNKLRVETVINGRTISWSFFPIPTNQVVHCYAADITERTSLEAQLRQAQKMESVGQLAAGVAHDFNNILSVIQGYSALLMEEKDVKPETGEALKQINSATQRATHLTRQLLTFSRKQAIHVQTLDLNEVINSVSKLLRRVLGESVTVQFDFLPNLPPVEADTGMMEQIVMNLAINARDAMPKGGQLTITTAVAEIDQAYAEHNPEARSGKFVCLSVADAGCGMDEATLGRIFEPFFTTKPAGRGTGLGLATVYGIVKQHGGWIEVQSQIGVGTTFKIYLPASERLLTPVTEAGARQVVRGGSETVLLVEDEPAVLAMAAGILERLGYKVLAAPSGDDAAQIWSRQGSEIHLLLTDMVMPGELNGRQLAEKLLTDRPELKVIYTSGYSVDLLGTGLVNSRNFVFLQKPYHPDTLALMVRNCLDVS